MTEGMAGRTGDPDEALRLGVLNLDCESDAGRLRRGLESLEGILELRILPTSSRVEVRLDTARLTRAQLEATLERLGFPPVEDGRVSRLPAPWRNPKVITSVASGVLLGVAWGLDRLGLWTGLVPALHLMSVISGGFYFAREAVEDLIHERSVGIELLMSVAAVAAFALGHAGEAAMLAFLYSISEAAEGYTEERTRGAIRALMKLAPRTATVMREGREEEVAVETLVPGDVFLVRPGSVVPTDGEILTGRSSVNEASLTGESIPVDKGPGDRVLATSINADGALEVRATARFAENSLSRIIHLVEEAQDQKGRSHRFIERFGAIYSPVVLFLGLLTALAAPVALGGSWSTWMMRGTILIVAAAPCALAISVPITFVAAIGRAARRGILIKGGVHLEALATLQAIVFDKTGTLTRGEPEVTDVIPMGTHPEEELLATAAAVETRSQHPLARSIVRHAREEGSTVPPADDFQSLPGAGATARVHGRVISVTKPAAVHRKRHLEPALQRAEELEAQGKTVVVIADEVEIRGVIALKDTLRPGTKEALQRLRQAGVRSLLMLTGDNRGTARAIASEAGLDEFRAELTPEDKVKVVKELKASHGAVAMVGDGVNDAPALAAATVGIAMGAAGTDVALEAADVALMTDNLARVPESLILAREVRRLVRQNLALSAIVILVMVGGALGGLLNLPMVVIAHELSELAVILNGLRILRSRVEGT